MENDAIGNIAKRSDRNRGNPGSIFFEKSEADIEKNVHKDYVGNIPYVRMPGIMSVYLKRRIDIKRKFPHISEIDIDQHRKNRRNTDRYDPDREKTLKEIRL